MTPALLWVPFIAYWVLAARKTRQSHARVRGTSSPVRGALYLAGGALIFMSPSLGPLDDRIVPAVVEVGAAGWVLTALGMLFSIWARVSLGRNWSGRVVLKYGQELVSTGPYGLVRHPIYTGLLVALTGTALYDGRWRAVLGVILFAIGFWLKARSEERLLDGEFGEEYRSYRARTPMLIPSLAPGRIGSTSLRIPEIAQRGGATTWVGETRRLCGTQAQTVPLEESTLLLDLCKLVPATSPTTSKGGSSSLNESRCRAWTDIQRLTS